MLGASAGRLLAICSVFRGGISLDAVESVCTAAIDLGIEVLDGLEELVDQSLLRRVEGFAGPGGPRFGMLFMVREYAAERLAELQEQARVEQAHAATFLALAEEAGRALRGPSELEWLDRLETEHQNIRAAIDWYQQHEPRDALRLAAAMSRFWGVRGHFTEGRRRLTALLGLTGDKTSIRVKALNGAASLAIDQADHQDARNLLGESIRLSEELGYRRGEATALVYLSRNLIASERPAAAGPHIDRALQLLEGSGDPAASRSPCCTPAWRRILPASSRRPGPGTAAALTCARRSGSARWARAHCSSSATPASNWATSAGRAPRLRRPSRRASNLGTAGLSPS